MIFYSKLETMLGFLLRFDRVACDMAIYRRHKNEPQTVWTIEDVPEISNANSGNVVYERYSFCSKRYYLV